MQSDDLKNAGKAKVAEYQKWLDALELVYNCKLVRHGLYIRIPTDFFHQELNEKALLLPEIAFYRFDGKKVEKLKNRNQKMTPEELHVFPYIWIHENDFIPLWHFSEELITGAHGPINLLTPQKRAKVLQKSAVQVMDDLFRNPTEKNISRSKQTVGSFVKLILRDPYTFFVLSRLSSHDHYTLQHSVGTSINCIILGKKAGVTDNVELINLGLAGILHDIGKTGIPMEIINKKGKLNEDEWKLMKAHPKIGYEMIKSNPIVNGHTKKAILEHHENKEGSGYPEGTRLSDLHLYTKIVGLCDKFNALTTNRSYAEARSTYDALDLIGSDMRKEIDTELFAALVKIYGGYV